MTIIEQILRNHSAKEKITPGDIVDVLIDVRLARDFGGANVVNNLINNDLQLDDNSKTFFTFDCNPTGSDQKYAANQQFCRNYARENNIKTYDINEGIGTHIAIDKGLSLPGSTSVSTDSHANILGAIGAFGQGMGDKDIAAVWAKGSVWFKVPKSAKITIEGKRPNNVSAKDIILNMLKTYGANTLLGYSVELYGDEIDKLTLDERITISSMATELGAVALIIPPSDAVIKFCEMQSGKKVTPVYATEDAKYDREYTLNMEDFSIRISRPGHPEDAVDIEEVKGKKIDSAFVGSCTNGRMEDMRIVAKILKDRKIAPGVMLKIVPATDEIWNQCLDEGIISIFKKAGALVGNAGCAGCASGQIGQNGPGEITVSTGNRNFPGKQGKGEVYLASPATVTASAVAGFITHSDEIPETPAAMVVGKQKMVSQQEKIQAGEKKNKNTVVEGKVWFIDKDNIDTDMIFHNKYLSITDISEMGQYTFDNLEGWKNYAKLSEKGDIVITGENFGAGSSRQQAVDCFKSLGNQLILAKSYGAIYERNAINAAFPVLTYLSLDELELKNRDLIRIDLATGLITNIKNNKKTKISCFS